MKISVLGNIIDTEDIYQITPIEKIHHDNFKFQFVILFFNKKTLIIEKKAGVYLNNKYIHIPKEKVTDFQNGSLERALNSLTYRNNLKLLEELREEIIKYWSNNQPEIPKIEFKN